MKILKEAYDSMQSGLVENQETAQPYGHISLKPHRITQEIDVKKNTCICRPVINTDIP